MIELRAIPEIAWKHVPARIEPHAKRSLAANGFSEAIGEGGHVITSYGVIFLKAKFSESE